MTTITGANSAIQYSRAPKNMLPMNDQAGISRFFKNMPGWKFEDESEFGKWVQKSHIVLLSCNRFDHR